MFFSPEVILLVSSILLILGLLASIASNRMGVPALILFLVIGMVAGSDGVGGIPFDDARLAQLVGIISLVLILFDGGMSTNLSELRRVAWKGFSLATIGVLLTTISVGLFSSWILKIPPLYGLLLGAVISSTDAAAVFSVLRAGNASLKNGLQSLLELESGSNDPIAVFLTMGLITLIKNPTTSIWGLIPMFVQQMLLGLILGYVFGRGMTFCINRVKLNYEGLYPVLTIALVLLTYGLTTILGGSGFLAVYVSAVALGNTHFIHKKSLMHFHDSLSGLMQIILFLTLGLLSFPSRLPAIALPALLIAAFLILIGRPFSVFIALSLSGFTVREKTLIAWVGLRGATPIVLATFPLVEGLAHATLFFDIVFFTVLTSILLQGSTLTYFATWLHLNTSVGKESLS